MVTFTYEATGIFNNSKDRILAMTLVQTEKVMVSKEILTFTTSLNHSIKCTYQDSSCPILIDRGGTNPETGVVLQNTEPFFLLC
jgi:hypothetical protein